MLGGWRGGAGDAYGSAWELWHRGAGEVQLGLSISAKAVGLAGLDYQDNESASAAKLRVSTMPEAFRVDPEALADAVERMGEYLQYVEGMLSEIDSLVTNLHLTWSGEAAAAHVEAHRHWARGEAMMS